MCQNSCAKSVNISFIRQVQLRKTTCGCNCLPVTESDGTLDFVASVGKSNVEFLVIIVASEALTATDWEVIEEDIVEVEVEMAFVIDGDVVVEGEENFEESVLDEDKLVGLVLDEDILYSLLVEEGKIGSCVLDEDTV